MERSQAKTWAENDGDVTRVWLTWRTLRWLAQVDFLLVTEVVTGGSLHSIIHGHPNGKLEYRQVLEYASQVRGRPLPHLPCNSIVKQCSATFSQCRALR